jgi:hypothetical protein
MVTQVTERVPFRMFQMECCHTILCHVNHRLPMYCSGCGASVYPQVRGWSLFHDEDATLVYDGDKKT